MFFGVGLWLTRENPDAESYATRMRPLLDMLVEVAPGAKIVARSMAGAVQSVVRRLFSSLLLCLRVRAHISLQACFDLWRIQRRIIEPANAALFKCVSPSLSLSALAEARS